LAGVIAGVAGVQRVGAMVAQACVAGIRLLLAGGGSPGLALIGQAAAGADRGIAAPRGGIQPVGGRLPPGPLAAAEWPVAGPVVAPLIVAAAERRSRAAVPVTAGLPLAVARGTAPTPGASMWPGRVASASAAFAPPVVRGPRLPVTPAVAPMVRPEVSLWATKTLPAQPASPLPAPQRHAPQRAEMARFAPSRAMPVERPRGAVPATPRLPWLPPMTVATRRAMAPEGMTPQLADRSQGDAGAADPPSATRLLPRLAEPQSLTASPAPGHGGGPGGGDVFLDGMRVGRWMARELARQAGGPQAGGTAFDPRSSPAWPGALQGS
jgi:hypothetical protein